MNCLYNIYKMKVGGSLDIMDSREQTWKGKAVWPLNTEYKKMNDTYKQVPVKGRKEFFEDENNKTLSYYRVYQTGPYNTDIIIIYKYQKFENGNYYFNTSPDSEYGTKIVSENDDNLYFEVPRQREEWELSMEGGKRRRNSKKRNTKRRNSKKRRSYKKR